jgi:hypothetical protein
MQSQKVLHDFGELTHEDVSHFDEALAASRTTKEKIRSKPYSFLLAALALGVCFGYLARRS